MKPEIVFWFILSSFVCLGLSYGLILWSRRPGQEKLDTYLKESSAGDSVNRAQAVLDQTAEFERA